MNTVFVIQCTEDRSGAWIVAVAVAVAVASISIRKHRGFHT